MNLRTKTIVMVVVTTVILIGIVHTFAYTVLLNSYTQLERGAVTQTVQSIQGALSTQYSVLDTSVRDWASSDTAYQFILYNGSAFIAQNMIPSTFVNNDVNYILFVRSNGSVVYGLGYNLVNSTEYRVPQSVMTALKNYPNIWTLRSLNSSATGLVTLPEGPLVVASSPVLTSQGRGPIYGSVVFARYLDQGYLETLSDEVRVPLNLMTYSTWQLEYKAGSLGTSSPSVYVRPINSSTIAGYDVVNDIGGHPAVVLLTTVPRSIYQEGLTTVNYDDFSLGVASAAFGAAVLFLIESVVVSRLQKLDANVAAITAHGDAPTTLQSISGDDAIASLSRSINTMLAELNRRGTELRKSERFSAIGELATMIAHDLRNPLQGIQNAAFYLKRSRGATEEQKKMIAIIEEDVRYANKIVNDLLDYSREMRLEMRDATPKSLIRQALSMVPPQENIHIIDESGNEPVLRVDIDRIVRVFVNMINNAIDAMPRGGTIVIKTNEAARSFDFMFADDGVGMTEEVKQKIFTPLYTTKAKGMGFGLAISKRIIEAHGGRISVESKVGSGTTFTISLPKKGGEEKE